jgi:nucleotidyltransferase substrate binding protein (TIGR01987 family)
MNAITNFRKTVAKLQSFLALPIQNDRDRAGIFQAFEFTFEQSWKSIQKIAGSHGVEVASPKKAFGVALQNGWIHPADEPRWLEMIKDRNLTSHTYEEELAKKILEKIQQDYIAMFESLLLKLESEIESEIE